MTLLVTGGTKGIGLAIAAYLAGPGDPVVLNYHTDERAAAEAKARVEATGATVALVRANIGSIDGCADLLSETAKVHSGTLHIVHSAALIYPTTLLGADLEKFTGAVRTNGLSLLYLVQKALPLLSRGSSIVFISSNGARNVVSTTYGALGAGKALAEGLIRYLVPELAPRGIRINAVAPGLVHTTSVANMVGSEAAATRLVERAAQTNPSGRETRDSDYASVVRFLLSPEAEFVQGQVIAATGGAQPLRHLRCRQSRGSNALRQRCHDREALWLAHRTPHRDLTKRPPAAAAETRHGIDLADFYAGGGAHWSEIANGELIDNTDLISVVMAG